MVAKHGPHTRECSSLIVFWITPNVVDMMVFPSSKVRPTTNPLPGR